LLVTAGRSRQITPATVARETALEREATSDLFRQLDEAGAVHRESYEKPVVETPYSVDAVVVRESFTRARTAVRVVAAHRERVPQPEVTPLITFPDDPSFDTAAPATFGMSGLMSTLASEVKQSQEEIVLLSPFFEGDGLDRLADVLLDALDRGVEVTIVTRYLQDTASYNRSVISEFVERAREYEVAGALETVDYTVWDRAVPVDEQRQDGANPAFTLHAKVMTFDERAVYVGSANVTDYGFGRYLELGVLLHGPPVSRFLDLCEFLLDSSAAEAIRI
jgi:putative cardiolipin synthase